MSCGSVKQVSWTVEVGFSFRRPAMNRSWATIMTLVILACCLGGESQAGLFSGLFGGGACASGSCAVSGGFSEVQGFGVPVATYSAPRRMFARRAQMSFEAPMSFGAGGGCYSQSYAPQSFSAPMAAASSCYSQSYAPQQAYSYSVPVYQVAPPQQFQAAPSPQTQSSPPLPSKMAPSMEYAPVPSKSPRSATTGGNAIRRSIREITPTATIACGGHCCGGEGDCECGENCGCGSAPGAPPQPRKKERTRIVDYSGMVDRRDLLRLVDYDSVSEISKKVRTSMR
jgi:hypothetical protein